MKGMGTTAASLFRGSSLVIIGLCLLLGGCDNAEREAAQRAREARQALWADAKAVRICVDGTYIYKLNDGTYRAVTGWGQYLVDGPEVCR
jgi:hypothetical protein